MKSYLIILNFRTLIVLAISVATILIAYAFNISYNVDLTLISIAIIFPLVFTIRGSFRRREKALEHLSQFRASLKTVEYFVMCDLVLPDENKKEFSDIIQEISEKVVHHLKNNDHVTTDLDVTVDKLYRTILAKNAAIPKSLRDKIFKYFSDFHESIENLLAIHIHRTPISLKAYCLVFIYVFPLIYTPTIIHNLGPETSKWVTYFIVILSGFILISLYNIQNQLEYPFDDVGLDDIKLDGFRLKR